MVVPPPAGWQKLKAPAIHELCLGPEQRCCLCLQHPVPVDVLIVNSLTLWLIGGRRFGEFHRSYHLTLLGGMADQFDLSLMQRGDFCGIDR